MCDAAVISAVWTATNGQGQSLPVELITYPLSQFSILAFLLRIKTLIPGSDIKARVHLKQFRFGS